MQKSFYESLRDGFKDIAEITDPSLLKKLRSEGIRIDSEPIYRFSFGPNKEFDLQVEPVGEDGNYLIALYSNGILLTEKLPVWIKK